MENNKYNKHKNNKNNKNNKNHNNNLSEYDYYKNLFYQYSKYRKMIDINAIDVASDTTTTSSSIAIIIPHRNRLEHLKMFINHFEKLDKKNNNVDVYVIDQNNLDKFNRGLLLNIGFLIASETKKYDKYIFHDVDSYPEQILYDMYFKHNDKIIHYASPYLDYKYKFYSFFGGVVGINESDYRKINGFPNNFWGHGGEDDAMLDRIIAANLTNVFRPNEGKYYLADHERPTELEYNRNKKKNIVLDVKNWKSDGVQQLKKIFINIKKNNTYDEFVSFYHTDVSNVTNNAEPLNSFIEKIKNQKMSNNELNMSITNEISNEQKILNKSEIKYFFYKIDYLSIHRHNLDFFVDTDFVEKEIELKNKKLLETDLKGQRLIFNKNKKSFVSILYPIVTWDEVVDKIINTYTPPNLYVNKNKINKDSKLKQILKQQFEKYNKNLSKKDLFDTLKHIFDNYNEVLYFRIRNGSIECQYHLYSQKNKKDWYKDLKYVVNDKTMSVDEAFVDIALKSNKQYFTLKKPHFTAANNCLLTGLDEYEYWEGNPVSYVKSFKEMIEFVVNEYDVPDCDILINRKDFPYLRKDKKYAYSHLTNDAIEEDLNFYPVGSQAITGQNMDIPIISADEWEFSKTIETTKKNVTSWETKQSVALFRGSATGCSVNDENPRIRLAQLSKNWENDAQKSGMIDAKLSKLVGRVKVYNQLIGVADYKKYKHLVGDFLSTEQQLKYKYIFNVEGNSQAYRFSSQFYKGLVINVKSEYYMWFDSLLEKNKHFVEVNSDYSDLYETLSKLKSNDKESKQIYLNGIDWANTYINTQSLAEYMFYFMYYLNKYST